MYAKLYAKLYARLYARMYASQVGLGCHATQRAPLDRHLGLVRRIPAKPGDVTVIGDLNLNLHSGTG